MLRHTLSANAGLLLRRPITINHVPSQLSESDSSAIHVATQSNIDTIDRLQASTVLENPEFKALGTPPALLSVDAPASVPVYVRRKSLVALYGFKTRNHAIDLKLEMLKPMSRLSRGWWPFLYERLTSTTPFSVLVSSRVFRAWPLRDAHARALATINLNGASDWALVNRHCLQAFSGNSLAILMHKYPRRVSPALARTLDVPKSTKTGLGHWPNMGYTLLSGRGTAAITGMGSIYSISIEQGQELTICRENLVAVSVAGPLDLENCIAELLNGPKISKPVPLKELSVKSVLEALDGKEPFFQRLLRARKISAAILKQWAGVVRYYVLVLRNYMIGHHKFLRMIGPRNILVQSNSGESHFNFGRGKSPESTPSDYLNYVTIEDGSGAKFHSTPDFSRSVHKIEQKIKG